MKRVRSAERQSSVSLAVLVRLCIAGRFEGQSTCQFETIIGESVSARSLPFLGCAAPQA
jgi:hypothetical protein